ncbi:S1 family peptidase [Mycobacteroides abscessus]|uniref:S1 family peptidase n=1 Tax=Mycobacteroides abscessus TaxID=36809 RepID=UPI0009A6408F|nr:S1 family peptidase [Mycobacteroides abscessus]SKV58915.1 Trypsin [Mycobacteroides abscessus subsp. massiliense]
MKKYGGSITWIQVILLTTTALVAPPHSRADTDAYWAWPGMRFDVYADHSWSSCSVGFPAWDSAGKRYFITAGHCFRDDDGSHYVDENEAGMDIYSPGDHSTPVGYERSHAVAGNGWYTDVSLVEMYPGEKLHGDGWNDLPSNATTADVGDSVCLAGYQHEKTNCGTVTETDATIIEDGYPWKTSVTRTSYCSHHGDSGGAVYNRYGALGINVTGSEEHNEPGTPGACRSSYIPITTALRLFRKSRPSLTI